MKHSQTAFALVLVLISTFVFLHTSQAADDYYYDSADRLEKVIYDDGQMVTYSYDNRGNRQSQIAYAPINVALNEPANPGPVDAGSGCMDDGCCD